MAQTILYYPYINIQDGTWLRNAILYWDEVSSIVPYDNYPDLSPELLYLQESGAYKAVYPRDLFFSEFKLLNEVYSPSIPKIDSKIFLVSLNSFGEPSKIICP